MPARDKYHDVVKAALIKDGWTITHDPLYLIWGKAEVYVDLGAELLIAAQKASRKIAVEIKCFSGPSQMVELRNALGQFVLYRDIMGKVDVGRELYLAIDDSVYDDLFEDPIGELLLENERLYLIVFDPDEEEIVRWYP